MGWDAEATKNKEGFRSQRPQTAEPHLKDVFVKASATVQQIAGPARGIDRGIMEGASCGLVLERATRVQCFEQNMEVLGLNSLLFNPNAVASEIEWSAETVKELNAGANWDFPQISEDEGVYPDWYDMSHYWTAKIFLETCAAHGLGIRISW